MFYILRNFCQNFTTHTSIEKLTNELLTHTEMCAIYISMPLIWFSRKMFTQIKNLQKPKIHWIIYLSPKKISISNKVQNKIEGVSAMERRSFNLNTRYLLLVWGLNSQVIFLQFVSSARLPIKYSCKCMKLLPCT